MEENTRPNLKQTKRQWTPHEDAKLVECLVELATTSWKCDNGTFKSGYGKHLEKMLHEKIPGCDLKANPHIESRVKLLKRQYFAIVEMMGTAGNGFGWNDKDKMIVVERQIFNEWKSSHPNANGLYNKPFPHFEELGIAFGRDRAQGGNAENVIQAVATMEAEREATLSDRQVNENTQVNLEETEMEYEADSQEPPTPGIPVAPGASAAPSSSAAPSASYIERNKRKRGSKSEEVIDIVVESMRDMKGAYQEHTAVLVDMVSCFKHEKEGAERRMKLMELLRDVPGLSGDDRMKAGLSILRDNSLIDMVFQLQPGELLPFLKKLL
ncbi:hypothetical protein HN51_052216 [Arachis hypogaea]|uniref:uncharacterized protein n=1 Tax=Arachis hypogaea TaxID=3818 RepID=UPI000DEDBB97|nr:uncharacterized protein LOC112766726 [Arachis hypogaea]